MREIFSNELSAAFRSSSRVVVVAKSGGGGSSGGILGIVVREAIMSGNRPHLFSNQIEVQNLQLSQLHEILAIIGYSKATPDLYCAKKRRYHDHQADVFLIPILRIRLIDGCRLVVTPITKMLGGKSVAEQLRTGEVTTSFLVGKRITSMVNYMEYVCLSIDEDIRANSGFMVDGEEITYGQYYQQRYGRKLDENKPFLKARLASGDVVHLPAEYCHFAKVFPGRTLEKKTIDAYRFSLVTEGQFFALQNLLKEFDNAVLSKYLAQQKVTIGKDLLKDKAFALSPCKVELKVENIKLDRILVILPKGQEEIRDQFLDFAQQFKKIANTMNINGITMALADYELGPRFEESLASALQQGVSLALVVVPDDPVIYAKVKCVGVHSDGYVATQVLTFDTLRKASEGDKSFVESMVQNVVCQVIAKLAPVSWVTPSLQMGNTMVIGLSVGPKRYDSNGNGKQNFGLISSLNDKFTLWTSRCHENYDEKRLSTTLKKALRSYKETHYTLPTAILIFREGQSEKLTMAQEVETIQKAIEMVREVLTFEQQIKFAVLSVNKSAKIYAEILPSIVVKQLSSVAYVETGTGFDLICGGKDSVEVCEYTMIYDGFRVGTEQYADLASKLSYGYPGGCGQPSVYPSPVQCAIKLRNFISTVGYDKNYCLVRLRSIHTGSSLMIRNVLGPSTSTDLHEPPTNVASKVAEVFLTAGHAFQRLGDLTLQLHNAEDVEESKWSEGDVEALRESLTKFAHELDTISERVQSRTMQIIKTDIKRRMVIPTETIPRVGMQSSSGSTLTGLKRPAGGPLQMQPSMAPKRLIPFSKPPGFSTAPVSRISSGSYSNQPIRTNNSTTFSSPRLSQQVGSSLSSHGSSSQQRPMPNEQYFSSQGAYIQNG
ncbi:unnamed protein product, partial [Mesorhabditis belari]|uniref:Piwi domain-containing protein n=1 Tax=Mesorhabditis belari TaxID=2138241 RepID=A0AAF3F423_9BILA